MSAYTRPILENIIDGDSKILVVFDNYLTAKYNLRSFTQEIRELPFKYNEVEMLCSFNNGAKVYFDYAMDYQDAIKFTGMRYTKIIIDFRSDFDIDTLTRITSRDFGESYNKVASL